jgi:predicted amidohydrolase
VRALAKYGARETPALRHALEASYDNDAFAGRSWLVSPEGEILLETSADSPFLSADVDLTAADRAKHTYPRNIPIP